MPDARKWRQYRGLNKGEFVLAFADCSQGGSDYNAIQFLSYDRLDVPLVYHSHGVAALMTADLIPVLERIFKETGMRPLVAYERNNGGGSEMERLRVLNHNRAYKLFTMKKTGDVDGLEETRKLGWDTTTASRSKMLGDLQYVVNSNTIRIYDKPTIDELYAFILNKSGKPEAKKGSHDDLVMSLAGVWQMYQLTPGKPETTVKSRKRRDFTPPKYFDDEGFL